MLALLESADGLKLWQWIPDPMPRCIHRTVLVPIKLGEVFKESEESPPVFRTRDYELYKSRIVCGANYQEYAYYREILWV